MTTDPLTTAARAYAATNYAVDWDTPEYYDSEDRQEAENFMAGAAWARDHLAAEVRKAQAGAWDEACQAFAWCRDNGPIEDALPYVAEHNPYTEAP